jgi:NDP-sugar pyrophosphorylase family protein
MSTNSHNGNGNGNGNGHAVNGGVVPVNGNGHAVNGFVPPEPIDARAVILAGGKGTRLGPYTTVLPKPLLPIGNKAILDVVVRQLNGFGITDMTFAVGYLAHLVEAVFGDGSDFGVNITYHREEEPLGTVGPLAVIDGLDEPFLFMNGDVLTALDYSALYRTHCESGNALTIATHERVVRSEYGVLELGAHDLATRRVTGYQEKPEIGYTVSMGIYVADPRVIPFIPTDTRYDLPDLVLALLDAGETVGSYMTDSYWLDIGRHDDYEQAIADFDSLAPTLLATSG